MLKEEGKLFFIVNGREAVDLFKRKLGPISDIRPGNLSSQILVISHIFPQCLDL